MPPGFVHSLLPSASMTNKRSTRLPKKSGRQPESFFTRRKRTEIARLPLLSSSDETCKAKPPTSCPQILVGEKQGIRTKSSRRTSSSTSAIVPFMEGKPQRIFMTCIPVFVKVPCFPIISKPLVIETADVGPKGSEKQVQICFSSRQPAFLTSIFGNKPLSLPEYAVKPLLLQ